MIVNTRKIALEYSKIIQISLSTVCLLKGRFTILLSCIGIFKVMVVKQIFDLYFVACFSYLPFY